MSKPVCLLTAVTAASLVATSLVLVAQEKGKPEQEPAAKQQPKQEQKPKTYEAKRLELKRVIELSGLFEPAVKRELSLELDELPGLDVLEAVPHGSPVKKGQILVKVDTEKIDRAIGEAKVAAALADISHRQAKNNLKYVQQTAPLDLAAARRASDYAGQDYNHFVKVERPMSEQDAKRDVIDSQNYLEYAMEELKQLEKMYKADELTEETEEIVLKRQRDTVERLKFSLQRSKVSAEQTLKVMLPRREVSMSEQVRRTALELAKAEASTPLNLEKAKLDLAKAAFELEKAKRKLEGMLKDRKAIEIKAPCDGIVYYGRCVRGNWPDSSTLEDKFRRGGKIMPNEVFMTVVQPKPLFVRVAVDEEYVGELNPGLRAVVTPAGLPELRLEASLDSMSPVPYAPSKFDAKFALKASNRAAAIMPGMKCTLKVLTYAKAEALVVPAPAVFADELGLEHYVYVVRPDGKHERRSIEGRKVGDKFEVLQGLKLGEKLAAEKPKED